MSLRIRKHIEILLDNREKRYLEEQVRLLESQIQSLELDICELILNGTGPDYSWCLYFLDKIGYQRLCKFKKVHIASGSLYAYSVYWASQNNRLNWNLQDFERWNYYLRRWFNTGFFSIAKKMIKTLPNSLRGKSLLDNRVDLALKSTLVDAKDISLRDFPPNVCVWTNRLKNKDCSSNECYQFYPERDSILLTTLTRMTTSLPHLFENVEYAGRAYSDPVFNNDFPRIIRNKADTETKYIELNMHENKFEESNFKIKIHPYYGKVLLIVNLFKFVFAMKIRSYARNLKRTSILTNNKAETRGL